MKRSEIIKLMVETSKYHDGAYLEPYAAEKLLEAIEEAGMVPPNTYLTNEPDHTWEPEDENIR